MCRGCRVRLMLLGSDHFSWGSRMTRFVVYSGNGYRLQVLFNYLTRTDPDKGGQQVQDRIPTVV